MAEPLFLTSVLIQLAVQLGASRSKETESAPWLRLNPLERGHVVIYDMPRSHNASATVIRDESLTPATIQSLDDLPGQKASDCRVYVLGFTGAVDESLVLPFQEHAGVSIPDLGRFKKQEDPPRFKQDKDYDKVPSESDQTWHKIQTYQLLPLDKDDKQQFRTLKGSSVLVSRLVRLVTSVCLLGGSKNSILVLTVRHIPCHTTSKGAKLPVIGPFFFDNIAPLRSKSLNFESPHSSPYPLGISEDTYKLSKSKDYSNDMRDLLRRCLPISPVPALVRISPDTISFSNDEIMALIILRYYYELLRQYKQFVHSIETLYAKPREVLMDPGRGSLEKQVLAEATADAYFYQSFRERGHDIVEVMEGLLQIMKAIWPETSQSILQYTSAHLQVRGRDVIKATERLEKRLEHHLKYLEYTWNRHESESLRLLSQLASLFLPLTLATGILSMQNRLSDLGAKFYYFIGIIIILGTVGVLCLAGLKLYRSIRFAFSQLGHGPRLCRLVYRLRLPVLILFWICFFVTWALFVTSFLVGSFKSVSLGLKILGFGITAEVGLSLILFFMSYLFFWCLSR